MSNVIFEDKIGEFIEKLSLAYPEVGVEVEYYMESNYFEILHDMDKRQPNIAEFHSVVGRLLKDIFYANDIFNFSFIHKF